jgi:hypothetical protein
MNSSGNITNGIYERTQPLQRHHLAPRLRGLRPDGRARDSYYWPCRYLRSRVAGPGQDRIDYRFLSRYGGEGSASLSGRNRFCPRKGNFRIGQALSKKRCP